MIEVSEYIANNYTPVPESGCWLWLGGWGKNGYGKVQNRGTNFMAAHRLFYSIHKGEIPKGFLVCHKCDTPTCVNPDHLFLGTHKDNCHDKIAKGRDKIRLSQLPKSRSFAGGAVRFRGVAVCRTKFRVKVEAGGVVHNIGSYQTAEEAAHEYNRAAVRILGDKAILNPIGEP